MDSRQRERCGLMNNSAEMGNPEREQKFLRKRSPEECRTQQNLWRYGTDCGRNMDAGIAVRMGGMYGRKRIFGYLKSYDSGSKAAGTAAPSTGRKSPRQGAKALLIERSLSKVLLRYFRRK